MTHPAGQPGLVPASILQIEGDPTLWGVKTVGPHDPGWHDDPVAIDIGAPVEGTLILSPARAGSFALTPPPPGDGWMPAMTLLSGSQYLYIPTVKGLTSALASPGYLLAAQYDHQLPALQQDIMAAMDGDGSILAVNVNVVGGGVVILNGAQLPFVVLSPPAS